MNQGSPSIDQCNAGQLFCVVLLSVLTVFHVASLSCAADEQKDTDRSPIVAEINERKITRDQLDIELRRQLQGELQYFDESEIHSLSKQMLETMIRRELLLQAALKQNLIPTEQEVYGLFQSMKRELPSNTTFAKELAKYGMTEEAFAVSMREDLGITRYMKNNIFSRVTVDEREARKAFSESPQSFVEPQEVHARHILFKVSKQADEKEINTVRERAEKVLAEAKGQKVDFPELAKKYSDAPNSGKGGDLGFFTRNQMDEEFSQAAFSLDKGAVSDLVRTKHGFHIIKVEEKRGGDIPEFAEIQATVKATLLRKKREKLLSEHLEKLRRESRVIVYYQ